MFILDDETITTIRNNLIMNNPHFDLSSDSPELKPSRLLSHLLRLANSGDIMNHYVSSMNHTPFAKISSRMERDFSLQLEDIADDLANESLKRQLKDEEKYEECHNDMIHDSSDALQSYTSTKHLPLVLFLNADGASSLLKSKSVIERLAKESQNEDNVHLLMLGKGMNPLIEKSKRSHSSSQKNNMKGNSIPNWMNNNPFIMSNNPSSVNYPFSSPDQNGSYTNMNMPSGPNGDARVPFSFGPNNNASGMNDPEGSRRFNIFLGRTQDKDGNPGIMGAIAPPQAGNLFPHMFAMQQRQNANANANANTNTNANTNASNEARNENMKKWNEFIQQQMNSNGESFSSPQFFNASIASPFGVGETPDFMKNNMNGNPSPLPDIMKRVIQQAMTSVIDRLAAENTNEESNSNSKLPPHLAKAFAEVLSNENLRRGIAENLARAAPALVDPRCQGVMLSVYVPPPNNHPNRGMMPRQDQSTSIVSSSDDSKDKEESNAGTSKSNVGNWLNKILQPNNPSSKVNDEDDDLSSSSSSSSLESLSPREESVSKEKEDIEKESKKARNKRNRRDAIRTLAAAATAIQASKESTPTHSESKQQRGLLRLQSLCRNIPIKTPTDPVRARSWEGWKRRERGSLLFRKNRRVLLKELNQRKLKLKMENGKSSKVAMIRQMLSIRDVSDEISDVVKAAVEIEAARSQRMKVCNVMIDKSIVVVVVVVVNRFTWINHLIDV